MKIRIFGEVDPFEDEAYQTFFHITKTLDINLVLDLQILPKDDSWILEYDNYIGNISKYYQNIQKEKNKIVKDRFGEQYKKLDIKLDSLILRTSMKEYARWEYVGFTDDMEGYDGEVYILNIITNSQGDILLITEDFE